MTEATAAKMKNDRDGVESLTPSAFAMSLLFFLAAAERPKATSPTMAYICKASLSMCNYTILQVFLKGVARRMSKK